MNTAMIIAHSGDRTKIMHSDYAAARIMQDALREGAGDKRVEMRGERADSPATAREFRESREGREGREGRGEVDGKRGQDRDRAQGPEMQRAHEARHHDGAERGREMRREMEIRETRDVDAPKMTDAVTAVAEVSAVSAVAAVEPVKASEQTGKVERSAAIDAIRQKVAEMARALESLQAAVEAFGDFKVAVLEGDDAAMVSMAGQMLNDIKNGAPEAAADPIEDAEIIEEIIENAEVGVDGDASAEGEVISVDAAIAKGIFGTKGDDAMAVLAQSAHMIAGGYGSDAIAVKADKAAHILAGPGDDSLTIETAFSRNIRAGSGDDVVKVVSDQIHGLHGGGGNDKMHVEADRASRINGGHGDDIIVVEANRVGGISDGTGDDQISIAADTVEMIKSGAGNDVFDLQVGSANMSLSQGMGNDIVGIKDGAHLDFVLGDPDMMMDGATAAAWEGDSLVMTFANGDTMRIDNAANAGSITMRSGDTKLTLMASADSGSATGLFDLSV